MERALLAPIITVGLALLGADPALLRISARASKSNKINTPHIEHAHIHLVKCHGLPTFNLCWFHAGVHHAAVTCDGSINSCGSPPKAAEGVQVYQAPLCLGTSVMIETGIFVAAIVIMLGSVCLGYIWHGRS
jgi:hypothetical protein